VGPDAVKDAYRSAFRAHYEELLLGKLTAENWPKYMRFQGRENLDAALARKKGAILLNPHAGNFMMMIAAVSLAGYPFTQYAARGLAPPDVAAAHPEVFGHNWFRAETRRVREAAEDHLPARFLTLETPLRQLFRRLEANELVCIAFDGRIGSKFVKVPFLGRQALLNPGPYRMALATGAAIVPTMVECPRSGPDICHFGAPIVPDGHTAESLCAAFLQGAIEPWLRAHPEQYGTWLLHCRMRAGVDDHPLFIDYAPDDRWRKYERA
jgi:KDO2-lipid IV(A) lauroyltransferase